jgi:ribose transport system substrate-binding protein
MAAGVRWNWTTFAGFLVALLVALAAAGCGGDDEEGAAPPPPPAETAETAETAEPGDTGAVPEDAPEGVVEFIGAEPGSGEGLKLGYISLGESVPFVRLVSNGIREQAEIAGAELVFCDAAIDAAKALNCARTFATQQVDGYLNFDVFEDAAAEICAAGPDVPVISIDIHQRPCEVSFMGAANEYAGQIAGSALGQYMQEEFDCDYDAYVSLESSAAGVVNEQRMGGYRTGFQEFCPIENERVVDGADRLEPARQMFGDTLTALGGADRIVVVSINDDGILGALAAARTAGRADQLYVSGQGADPSAWCEIRDNPNWIADAAYFPERYGEIGVPYLIQAINGETIPQELLVPHVVINSENIEDFYELTEC